MTRKKKVLVVSGYLGLREGYVNLTEENHRVYSGLHSYDYMFVQEFKFSDKLIDPEVDFSWFKVAKCLELLKLAHWDYIFWIDADSIFWNMNRNFDDLFALEKDFVFTGDSWDVFNGGHFLVRNSKWSILFLQDWLSMRKIIAPNLRTSHKGKLGRLMDQPAMNILLYEGSANVRDLESSFNSVNGYSGNPERLHKFFQFTHAPTSRIRLRKTNSLISKNLRNNVLVVVQYRLNAYPFKMPGRKIDLVRADILHFPGDKKSLIATYCAKIMEIES